MFAVFGRVHLSRILLVKPLTPALLCYSLPVKSGSRQGVGSLLQHLASSIWLHRGCWQQNPFTPWFHCRSSGRCVSSLVRALFWTNAFAWNALAHELAHGPGCSPLQNREAAWNERDGLLLLFGVKPLENEHADYAGAGYPDSRHSPLH